VDPMGGNVNFKTTVNQLPNFMPSAPDKILSVRQKSGLLLRVGEK